MDIEMINPWTQVKSYHGHFERSQTVKLKRRTFCICYTEDSPFWINLFLSLY